MTHRLSDSWSDIPVRDWPKGRPMSELYAIVAADTARFERLAEAWQNLTVREQERLVAQAKDWAKSA